MIALKLIGFLTVIIDVLLPLLTDNWCITAYVCGNNE